MFPFNYAITLILLLIFFVSAKGVIHPPLTTGGDHNISYVHFVNGFPNVKCDFEKSCLWQWPSDNFNNITSKYSVPRGHQDARFFVPSTDASDNPKGHFLYLAEVSKRTDVVNLTSPLIDPKYFDKSYMEVCSLVFSLNTDSVPMGRVNILVQEGKQLKVIQKRVLNDAPGYWQTKRINLGHPEEPFKIIIEFEPPSSNGPSYIAIDNIDLQSCFPDVSSGDCPPNRKFRCEVDDVCIPLDMVCDISRDCTDASDEKQLCDQVPAESRCSFEGGWCGWRNTTDKMHTLLWKLNRGSTRNKHTGPSVDNTFKNVTGTYAYVDMSSGTLGSLGVMESAEFNPPPPVHGDPSSPYYNSCYITFFYHKYGPHSGSLGLYLKEQQMGSYKLSYRLWWSYGNKGDSWLRQVVILPNITDRYRFQFEARKSMSLRGDVAVDDVSLSPKCFGIGIPKEELGDWKYDEYPKPYPGGLTRHKDFENTTVYSFTSCGAYGAEGPNNEDCQYAYTNTSTQVTVLESKDRKGIQKWIVPETTYYTIIAKGARGGKGADALGESKGVIARVVTELYKDQAIYILVGQEGQDACRKLSSDSLNCLVDLHFRTRGKSNSWRNFLHEQRIEDGGGGGGGATFVFTEEPGHQPSAIIVAAGGGGLAHGPFVDDGRQNANGVNASLPNITAPAVGDNPAGAGGGWKPNNLTTANTTGRSLLEGGRGGYPCYSSRDGIKGSGGFGGGGGGCVAGGGGGGYTGGRAWSDSSVNGEGGWSMIVEHGQHKHIQTGIHLGPGSVLVIPAIEGCGCEYRCVALDEMRITTRCICSPGWDLKSDNRSCELQGALREDESKGLKYGIVFLIFCSVTLCGLSYNLYKRYLQQKALVTQRKVTGLQLTNLNSAPRSVRLSEFNPNYEFGGVTYTIRDLKEIPREKVQLVKPLGCGAFGDVYQGLLRNRDTDSVDMAVAVKILPALCSNQAESDFLMEALIMSKFNHPNIVHFIGACFDTHPRYIILELLAGGDLKNFLRENRPKVDKPSTLTMKDLLQCAIDVAKGCQYLEELHFIHRDIAARNCLLTSRGPGRVVKIADFGMSRDIYRSDYYKKGGKAMLPIKWMPPEAFLDGIFSSKTDVWSFGVLLWEIMSLGFMPYTAIRNKDVMVYVANGARLGAPANCPPPVFAIMGMCWSQDPNERPNFATIVERLGYCIQDPQVINTQLPVYKGPLPSEMDKTVMRPPKNDDYIQTDYMIPIMPDTPVEWKNGGVDFLNRYVVNGKNDQSPSKQKDNFDMSPLEHSIQHASTSNVNNPKSEDSNNDKPFTLSGQYVEDPKI